MAISSLSTSAPVVHPATRCESPDRFGQRCYKQHASDMDRWCPTCLDGHNPSGPLPSWMHGQGLSATQQEEARPSYIDRVDISRVSEIEWLGFELGCNGYAVAGSPEYTQDEIIAFFRGHEAGFRAYEEAEFARMTEEDERLENAYRTPEERLHQVEVERVNYDLFYGRLRAINA